MDNEIKKEELQSRREFFKKAAKAALPVVGAVVLSSLPIVKSEAAQTGCENFCGVACANDCTSTCQTTCYGRCYNTCHGTCSGGCATKAYA